MVICSYVQFEERQYFSTVKGIDGMDRAHLKVAKGSPQQNHDYCTKADTRVGEIYTFGELERTTSQGQRTELVTVRNEIKSGKRFRDLVEDDGNLLTLAKYPKFVERLEKEYQPAPARDDVKVTFHFGKSGTGKTHCACSGKAGDPDIYFYDGGFWDGYVKQSRVVFDEFGGHTLPPLQFQRICDKYSYTVSIKGTSAPLVATDIHITSNYLPEDWWKVGTKYNKEAIDRRFHEVHWHYEHKKFWRFVSDDEQSAMAKMRAKMAEINFIRVDPNTPTDNVIL